MVSAKQVNPQKLVAAVKEELKKFSEIQPSPISNFVKSGTHKQRPPQQDDFWYMRAAAILRQIYRRNEVGVSRLRTYFGGRKKFGHAPDHFRKSGGSHLRKIIQQLEKAGLVEKGKRGRRLTKKGRSFLDKAAKGVKNE